MNDATKLKYDVAVSFRNRDLVVALALKQALAPGLDVFVYSERQEDVAGTDGMESFRDVFLSQTLLAVVLYRADWGVRGMTAIEAAAIKERASDYEFKSFLWVDMEPDLVPPRWLPGTHIRYAFGVLGGVVQLSGVVRARLSERGATPRVETLPQLHARLAKAASDERQRQSFVCSTAGLAAAQAEVSRLLEVLERQSAVLRGLADDIGLESAERDGRWAVRSPRAYTSVARNTVATLTDGGVTVTVRIWNVPRPLPNESPYMTDLGPAAISDVTYGLHYVAHGHWTWGVPGANQRLPTEEFADALLRRHIELARGLGRQTSRGNRRHDY